MEALSFLAQSLAPLNVVLVFTGCLFGILVGAIPGLNATMAIALLVPFTYTYDIIPATALLLGIYCGGMYGGVITAVLLKVPGAPSNAATMLDGYPMVQRGESGKALAIATTASGIGGLISVALLCVFLTSIASFILYFSTEEYFVLTVFGIVIIVTLSGKSLLRGLLSALFGLFIATFGLDPVVPVPRFTFDVPNLLTGFPVVPTLIGLFCVSQGLLIFERGGRSASKVQAIASVPEGQHLSWAEFARLKWTILRSALIGTFVGIVPAAGPNVAAYFSYNEAKRWSKHPERFGSGLHEGVAAPEAANNAVPAGALLPALSFGIPGDTVTAILLGAFMLHGYAPGPMMIRDNSTEIYTMMVFLLVANIAILIFGLTLVRRLASFIHLVPPRLVAGVICVFGIAGGFAYSGQLYEALVTVAFGIIGHVMEKCDIPVVPMSISVLLGPMMEVYFRQSLIANEGTYLQFFTRPICIALWLLVLMSLWGCMRSFRRERTEAAPSGERAS